MPIPTDPVPRPVSPRERRQYAETIALLARQHIELVEEGREDTDPAGMNRIAERFMVPASRIRIDCLTRADGISRGRMVKTRSSSTSAIQKILWVDSGATS